MFFTPDIGKHGSTSSACVTCCVRCGKPVQSLDMRADGTTRITPCGHPASLVLKPVAS